MLTAKRRIGKLLSRVFVRVVFLSEIFRVSPTHRVLGVGPFGPATSHVWEVFFWLVPHLDLFSCWGGVGPGVLFSLGGFRLFGGKVSVGHRCGLSPYCTGFFTMDCPERKIRVTMRFPSERKTP